MAKGQKRTSREPRKPKQDKPKPIAAPGSAFGAIGQRAWPASARSNGSGR
jgi:hypothetical protein